MLSRKHIESTVKEILKGNTYRCFDRDSLRLFIESINSNQVTPFFLQQSKALIMLSWYIPRYPIKKLLTLTSNNLKTYQNRIEVKIPGIKKIVIPLFVDGKQDPLLLMLWEYLSMCVSLSFSGPFNQLQSTYTDQAGYSDTTRVLRYHLRRWLQIYNKKVEAED